MSFLLHRNIIIIDAGAGFHINGQLYLLTGWKNDFAIDPSEEPRFKVPFSSTGQYGTSTGWEGWRDLRERVEWSIRKTER